MTTVGSAIKLVAVFVAGIAIGSMLLAGRVKRPTATQPSLVESPIDSAFSPPKPAPAGSSSSGSGRDQVPSRPVRVIPIPRPTDEAQSRLGPETTGSATPEETDSKHRGWCNREACSHTYSSFDEESCTYKPYRGPRRRCEK
jgi:hypothetical protein